MVSKRGLLYSIIVFVLSIWMLVFLAGCTDGATADDGTITLRVTNADAHNGVDVYCACVASGDDMNDPANYLGDGNGPTITGGIAETLFYDVATVTTPVVFTGGESYDIGGIIDADGSADYTGGDYFIDPLKTVVVDGDMIVEVVYPTDFTQAP